MSPSNSPPSLGTDPGLHMPSTHPSNAKVIPERECEFENATNLRAARWRAVLRSKERQE